MPFFIPRSLKPLIKKSTWVILGQFVTLMGSLVLVRVLTSYLTPKEYGQLALSLTAVSLISQIAMNSVSASIGRYLPVAINRHELPDFASAAHKILMFSAGVSLLIGILLSSALWLNQHGDWALMCLLGFSFATMSLYNFTANTVQNAARHRAIVALHTSLETWLKVLFGVVAVVLLGASASSALVGYMVAVGLVLLSQWFFLEHVGRQLINQSSATVSTDSAAGTANQNHTPLVATFSTPKHNQSQWQHDIWQFAWPFATWGVFTWAQQVSDLWSLKTFASTDEVGLYTVIFQLGYAPIILLNAVVQVFLGPILNQRIEHAQDKHTTYPTSLTAKTQNDLNKSKSVHRITWATRAIVKSSVWQAVKQLSVLAR